MEVGISPVEYCCNTVPVVVSILKVTLAKIGLPLHAIPVFKFNTHDANS